MKLRAAIRALVVFLCLAFGAFLTLHLLTRERRISQAEAVADVGQFFSTLQRVHPDLLAKVSTEQYANLKQQTLDDVARKLDGKRKIWTGDLAYSLCYAAASFRDGHTAVQWYSLNSSGKRLPPFFLRYDNGRFVILASSDKAIEGLEVLSVNGCSTQKFLRPILDRISGETLGWKAHLFCGKQLFWYCFSNLCGSNQSLNLQLRDASGRESERTVETVNAGVFRRISSCAPVNKLEQQRRRGTRVQFYDSGSIAYFIYPAFTYSETEKKKIDRIFQEIVAKESRDLIIDLRGNGGGTSNMGDVIFSHIHKGKLLQVSKTRIKVSSDILSPAYTKLLRKFAGADIAAKEHDRLVKCYHGLEGKVVTESGSKEKAIEVQPQSSSFFSRRVLLLVDNGTFSSAVWFAVTFRDYNIGKILGYETGGVPDSFGDLYMFELKNSGIQCSVSWKQFFCPKPRPGDDERGVTPDIPMSDKMLRAYQREDDPVLAYTLDYIKKTRKSY